MGFYATFVHINWAEEPPEDGEINEMTPRSHAIEMVFIETGHAGSSARSSMLFFFKTLGLRSGSISGH